jgi:hypothetical protein
MSRLPQGDRIEIAPQSNIYTALVVAATVAVAVGLLLVYLRANALFPGGLFGQQ